MNARDDMSDTDVLTAVRDSLSALPLAGPPDAETITARGRALRRRRLIPGVTATLAAAAAAALTLTALAPVGHQASGRPAARLAAWTVTKLADGDISVTIRELEDPAGLRGALRADGVPASVTFASQQNPACRPYPAGIPQQAATLLLQRVFPTPYKHLSLQPPQRHAQPAHGGPPPASPSPGSTVIVIDPSALPGDAGVQLGATPDGSALLSPQVVYASPQCTGS